MVVVDETDVVVVVLVLVVVVLVVFVLVVAVLVPVVAVLVVAFVVVAFVDVVLVVVNVFPSTISMVYEHMLGSVTVTITPGDAQLSM